MPHPLAGAWTANLAKSRRDPNHQFHRATVRFAIDGRTVAFTYGGINASGKTEEGTRTMCADGDDHPDVATPGFTAAATLDARTLRVVGKKDGAVVGGGTYEVSDDGDTMTATMSGIDTEGRQFDHVVVFDRDEA